MTNMILNTDSYKPSHYLQIPENIERVSFYVEARKEGRELTFIGMNMFIKKHLLNPITMEDIDEAEGLLTMHGLPFNREGWEYILNKHNGYLPLRIDALEEGTVIQSKNVLAQVVNTDPIGCPWLGGYIETPFLRSLWYPTSVASYSRNYKKLLTDFSEKTSDLDLSELDFKLHDFGSRGVSSEESSAIAGIGHLSSFKGTDNIVAILAARKYYNCKMAAFSIPAAEHFTIIAWGRENEAEAYRNMLNQFLKPNQKVAVVSDAYDLDYAIDNIWGVELKQQIVESGGTLIIRPDSGEPIEVVNRTIEKLMNHFGYETNSKGYKVLPDYIRVIQGDGIDYETTFCILDRMEQNKFSIDNIAFGSGGDLLQNHMRDDNGFAMKASAKCVNGVWSDCWKSPKDAPEKASRRGIQALIKNDSGDFETIRLDELGDRKNYLMPHYENGYLMIDPSLDEIRERCAFK